MCGPSSAIGLADAERALWPELRERLRLPGSLMALMRGVLGDAEVGAVVVVTPAGITRPLAILATPYIVEEIAGLTTDDDGRTARGRIGDDEVEVLLGADGVPIAILASDWIHENLALYARELWHRRR